MERFRSVLPGLFTLALAVLPAAATGPGETASTDREVLATSGPLSAELGGANWDYTIEIERTRIEDGTAGFPPADIVSFAYAATDPQPDTRPVMFIFNGGPGSSSVWNHVSAWGPTRVLVPGAPDEFTPPPYQTGDNPGFLIDVADLVFVDPVATGLSQPADGASPAPFFGINADARSMCAFVETWLENNSRTGAPVFLSGNSYGAIRVTAMFSEPACNGVRPSIEGLILISGVLEMKTLRRHNTTPWIIASQFPTVAALAWYHGLVDKSAWQDDRDAFLDDAETFAASTLLPALGANDRMTGAVSTAHGDTLRRFTGFADYAGARHILPRFSGNMSNTTDRRPERYDGRFTRHAADRSSGGVLPPMGFGEIGDIFLEVLAGHVTRTTGFSLGEDYVAIVPASIRRDWDFRYRGPDSQQDTNLAYTLFLTLSNRFETQHEGAGPAPEFRILTAAGLYDQVTPYYAVPFGLRTAGIPEDLIETYRFEAGHMPYLDARAGAGLTTKIRHFIAR